MDHNCDRGNGTGIEVERRKEKVGRTGEKQKSVSKSVRSLG
jgi:hypothetical protein